MLPTVCGNGPVKEQDKKTMPSVRQTSKPPKDNVDPRMETAAIRLPSKMSYVKLVSPRVLNLMMRRNNGLGTVKGRLRTSAFNVPLPRSSLESVLLSQDKILAITISLTVPYVA